jgi:hypothetical protein
MVTFIATSYNETNNAYLFISSLLLQTNGDWKCIIYNDGKNDFIRNVVEYFNDERISYYESSESKGFWGHYNRIDALKLVTTEFIIQTSIQDYYIPTAVNDILNVSKTNDLILFNCLHHHFQYNILSSVPQINRVDWGSHAIRTDIAKKIGIRLPESSTSDGCFVVDCMSHPDIRYHKIEKVLTVHN